MMESLGLVLVALLAAVCRLVAWAPNRDTTGVRSGVAPHLLPDPALEWLRRAHGAIGVWITELDPAEEGPEAERIRGARAAIGGSDRRGRSPAGTGTGSGAERSGTDWKAGCWCFMPRLAPAVGLLLPESFDAGRLAGVEDDLRRLLEGVRRRPHIVALTQAQAQEASRSSRWGASGFVWRISWSAPSTHRSSSRLIGYQRGPGHWGFGPGRPPAARHVPVRPESELAQVAQGRSRPTCRAATRWAVLLPTGAPARRSVLLLPMKRDQQTVGAVAIWLTAGREPIGAARAELMEALGQRRSPDRTGAGGRSAQACGHYRPAYRASQPPAASTRRSTLITAKEGALVYADFDRFKSLNDTLGHPAGDAALVHFARIIREQIRSGDVPGRIGGEEFAVWLPETEPRSRGRIAERIRIKLGTTAWDWRGQRLAAERIVRRRGVSRRPAGAWTTCRPRRTRPCMWQSEVGGTGWRRRGGGRRRAEGRSGGITGERR